MALVHRWRLNEPNATDVAVDSVGNSHLTPLAGSGAAPPAAVTDARFGFCRQWGAWVSDGPYLSGPPLDFAFEGGGNWSLTWWAAYTGPIMAEGGLFYNGEFEFPLCTHGGAPHAAGHPHIVMLGQMHVRVNGTESLSYGRIGTDGNLHAANDNVNWETVGTWLHFALIRRGATLEFWYNGTLGFSLAHTVEAYIPNDDQVVGTFRPSPQAFWIGRARSSNTSENGNYALSTTKLADVRFYSHALTEAELVSDVVPLFVNQVTPTITLISPADQTTLAGTDTPLVVDVTGSLQYTSLNASFTGYSIRENVHNNTSFGPNYIAGSTRTAISDGYRYSLVRTGGWLTNPALTVDAISTSGNQA